MSSRTKNTIRGRNGSNGRNDHTDHSDSNILFSVTIILSEIPKLFQIPKTLKTQKIKLQTILIIGAVAVFAL